MHTAEHKAAHRNSDRKCSFTNQPAHPVGNFNSRHADTPRTGLRRRAPDPLTTLATEGSSSFPATVCAAPLGFIEPPEIDVRGRRPTSHGPGMEIAEH